MPEPHILFNVMPGTSTGRPLFMPTCLPGFMPGPAESMLPTITWSTWSPSTPARERTSLPTAAPSSVAGVSLSEPPKVPIPVLRGVEMTISPLPLPLPKLTLYSFRLYLIRGYIKRQSPDHAARTPLYALQRTALLLLIGPPLRLIEVAPVVGEHGVQEVHVSALEASCCLRCCSINSSESALLPSAWALRLLITPLEKSWVNWALGSWAETERSAIDW